MVTAVDDVSFDVGAGEVLGLVGESGSGKSVTGLRDAWAWSTRPAASPAARSGFDGRELVGAAGARDPRTCAARRIAMIFQDPMTTLNPVLRIDTQMIEAIRAHEKVRPAPRAPARLRDALGKVGIAVAGGAAEGLSAPVLRAACASAWRSRSRCCNRPA